MGRVAELGSLDLNHQLTHLNMFGLFKKKTPSQSLTETMRLIKAGQDDLLPAWIKQFGPSEVYVISKMKDDPSDLLVIGPADDKNYIAVFTDRQGLQMAVGDNHDILFPITTNGKALLEQARDSGRGLIINPTDESATVQLPAEMMAVFLQGLAIA